MLVRNHARSLFFGAALLAALAYVAIVGRFGGAGAQTPVPVVGESADISRLAGLNPSGVICEIMNEDGTMARLDDLIPFARRHGLKIGTIADLIAWRRRHDRFMERSPLAPQDIGVIDQ